MTTQQERCPLLNDEAAAARFKDYKSLDPFPDIPAALLNSADIYDYVRTTGMIYPFDSMKLKPASYEASVGEICIRWDEKGNKQKVDLRRKGSFVLDSNSIAFVTTRERFRLPDYMAVRFNLRITNVHRGLLLGTGPLVDPGFEGHLLIPLHNLTNNKYIFRYGEDLIWLEFTKISLNESWTTTHNSRGSRQGEYVSFREDKKNLIPDDYLRDPEIRSSIPKAILEAKESAKQAADSAERSSTWFMGVSAAGLISAVLVGGGIHVNIHDITGDLKEKQGATGQRVVGLQDRINELKDAIEIKEEQLRAMEKQVSSLRTRIAVLEETPEESTASKRKDPNQAETKTNQKIE